MLCITSHSAPGFVKLFSQLALQLINAATVTGAEGQACLGQLLCLFQAASEADQRCLTLSLLLGTAGNDLLQPIHLLRWSDSMAAAYDEHSHAALSNDWSLECHTLPGTAGNVGCQLRVACNLAQTSLLGCTARL